LKFLKCKPDPFSFYLNEGNEIVVMKRKKPIARLTIIQENAPEALRLDIGRVLNEAGVTKEEAFRARERARRENYG
jgi:antitoxin (DNA-binding transcriptional repressor) of toxin-antitoxin stability system